MTRIAVVGPGGVGTFFAAHLAAAGHDVVACSRRPFDRYVVESRSAPTEGPATVLTDPADVDAAADWVLVGVKAHQTDGAAGWLRRVCGPDTVVVAMQNGVEAESRLAPHVNGARVLASVVYCGATLAEPGHTVHSSAGHLILPDVDDARRLATLFEGTGAEIRPDPAYVSELWRKLALNVTVNGLTALTDRDISVVSGPPLRPVAHAVLDEAWAVGRAEGADLDAANVDKVLDAMAGARGNTSMHHDRSLGRPTEHDALYGAVVRFGQKHGISTPINAAVGAILAAGDPPA